jgi:hypothetical protein
MIEAFAAVGTLSATLWREIEGERVARPSVEPATALGMIGDVGADLRAEPRDEKTCRLRDIVFMRVRIMYIM